MVFSKALDRLQYAQNSATTGNPDSTSAPELHPRPKPTNPSILCSESEKQLPPYSGSGAGSLISEAATPADGVFPRKGLVAKQNPANAIFLAAATKMSLEQNVICQF